MSRALAIMFGVGLFPRAPGTWASAYAIAIGLVILYYLGFPGLVAATAIVIPIGFWVCDIELADRPGADPGEFVIDEVAGQWLTLLFPAAGFWSRGWTDWLPWPAWVAAFLLFRLFDIWKPWLIGRADRRRDPAGVMLDDLWAGLFAGVVTIILAGLYHLPLILMK